MSISADAIREYPGYVGCFTREDYLGASIRRGQRVRKANSEPGDAHPDGALGTVLGSIGVGDTYGYFVEWDARPKVAVLVASFKVTGG